MARVECFPSADALMAAAAERFVSAATQAIAPVDGTLYWLVDAAAGGRLRAHGDEPSR